MPFRWQELPYSRTLEAEADYVGMVLMSLACLDPAVAPQALATLSRDGGWATLDTVSEEAATHTKAAATEAGCTSNVMCPAVTSRAVARRSEPGS